MKITTLSRFEITSAVGLLLATGLTTPLFAQKKLNAIAVTVGDPGNPFFVQFAHGAQAQWSKGTNWLDPGAGLECFSGGATL